MTRPRELCIHNIRKKICYERICRCDDAGKFCEVEWRATRKFPRTVKELKTLRRHCASSGTAGHELCLKDQLFHELGMCPHRNCKFLCPETDCRILSPGVFCPVGWRLNHLPLVSRCSCTETGPGHEGCYGTQMHGRLNPKIYIGQPEIVNMCDAETQTQTDEAPQTQTESSPSPPIEDLDLSTDFGDTFFGSKATIFDSADFFL